MPWKSRWEGDFPSLGPSVLYWIAKNLVIPDGAGAGKPLKFTQEQAEFVIRLYAIDPEFQGPAIIGSTLRNARMVRRAILSRPKGWGKSPLVGALCIAESLAEVVPDGWDVNGQPVGRTWASLGYRAHTQVVAVTEDQTANTWGPILEMCREGPVAKAYPIEPLETFVNVPNGRIDFVTSSARSREGARPVFAVMDQTESWVPQIGGHKLAATIRRNLAKTSGCSVETPNAFITGEDSVAERSYEAARQVKEGRYKVKETGILLDHREAPADTDPSDEASLRRGLAVAYGDSAWVDFDRIVQEYYDPDTDPSDARRFFLNQIWSAGDAWIAQPEWVACAAPDKVVADKDMVTLGFDGSRKRTRGVTDATALIGCRVSDCHVFELGVWEQPRNAMNWQIPTYEVLAKVDEAFAKYNVVGFYADPAKWEGHVAGWEAKYSKRLKVKATRDHPIEYWMTGGRTTLVVRAVEQFYNAVMDGEMTHDGSSALTRHVLNARKRTGRSGTTIHKEDPESDRKIDAAIAGVLAVAARLDAIGAGVLATKPKASFIPRRVR